MTTCDNCGKTNCDCQKYEEEIKEIMSRQQPRSYDEKMKRAEETVRRWEEKEKKDAG